MSEPSTDSPAGPETPVRRPARGWYGIAFFVMLVGVAAFVASLNVARARVAESLSQMQRLVAPGHAELTFDHPGRYLVYYEKIGRFEQRDFDTTQVFREAPALDVDIERQETGEFLTVRQVRFEDNESQMFNHGQANSEFVFEVPAAGAYQITVAHENPDIDDEILLSVGPPVVGSMMADWRGPFGGAAVLAFAFVLSAVIVLVVWTLRRGDVTKRDD